MNVTLVCKNKLNSKVIFGFQVRHLCNIVEIMAMSKNINVRKISHIDKYKKKLKEVPVSNDAQIFVLSTGCYGMGRSILLKTSYDRYLFNCGEGIQKLIPDVVSRLGPVDNIFYTHNTWNNTGGTMGFLLSNCSEIKHVNTIRLHGPSNVDRLLEMTKNFSEDLTNTTKVEFHGIDKGKFEDNQLTVEYVELHKAESEPEVDQSVVTRASLMKFFEDDENDSKGKKEKEVVCYIVKLKELLRKVDPVKLLALKTKRGAWVKQVINGEEVTLPDGRIVKPDDVLMKKSRNIAPILVIDCPTEDYLDSLIADKQLLDLYEQGVQPVLMIHMAPASLITDPRYKAFMDRHNTETIHLMLNENSHCPYIHQSQMFQSNLNRLHPGIFPALIGHYQYNTKPKPTTDSIVQAYHGLSYKLRPESQRGFLWDDLEYYDQEESFKDMKQKAGEASLADEIEEELTKLHLELKQQEASIEGTEEDYPEIVFLGTGSAKPSLFRNGSGILLQMRKDEYFMMDCGEGTMLQLYQMYGLEKTEDILRNLKALFVSHLHYDHHGGLFGILEAREKAISGQGRKDRLSIFAPAQLNKWFHLFSRYISPIENSMELIHHNIVYEHMKNGGESSYISHAKKILNLSKFEVMPVVHTSTSYGISIKHMDGWKLVYSGDSMPSKALIKYGKDCDILIHEGTFDDNAEKDASTKRHSTTSQAIEVGRDMNAKYIMLTHFSQRFHKIPEFTDKFTEDVGFSFDFMQIRPSQLRLLHLLKPILYKMFGHDLETKLKRSRNKASSIPETEKSAITLGVNANMHERIQKKKKYNISDLDMENTDGKEDVNVSVESVSELSSKRKNDSETNTNKSIKIDPDVQISSIK